MVDLNCIKSEGQGKNEAIWPSEDLKMEDLKTEDVNLEDMKVEDSSEDDDNDPPNLGPLDSDIDVNPKKFSKDERYTVKIRPDGTLYTLRIGKRKAESIRKKPGSGERFTIKIGPDRTLYTVKIDNGEAKSDCAWTTVKSTVVTESSSSKTKSS